uniref:Glucuronosyltransferase n=1 Tax=Meloidogyne floridensis TaxID=298350 RepID=A0A915PDS2_9BILA
MPTVIPVYFWGEKPLTAFLTGAAFRYCFALHATWLINSVAHKFGYRPYDVNISPAESAFIDFFAIIGQAYERKVTPISNIYRQMGRQLEQLHKRVMDSHKSF